MQILVDRSDRADSDASAANGATRLLTAMTATGDLLGADVGSVARFGGDEFVVISDFDEAAAVMTIAEHILGTNLSARQLAQTDIVEYIQAARAEPDGPH